MNATLQHQKQMADYLRQVTDFCLVRGKTTGRMFVGNSAAEVFRYVSFCHLTGRLNSRFDAGAVSAVLICWPDWQEHIEHKASVNKPQFEWTKVGRGDSIFLAETIGSRAALRVLYDGMMQLHPHLLTMRVFTMRHGKLVRLDQRAIERFMR